MHTYDHIWIIMDYVCTHVSNHVYIVYVYELIHIYNIHGSSPVGLFIH